MVVWNRILEDGAVEQIHRIVAYRCSVTDDDDNVSRLTLKWKKSDAGKFILEHSITPVKIETMLDHNHVRSYMYIIAELTGNKLTEYYLRFDINP